MSLVLFYIHLQKPIGIIGLLDEAWYSLSSSILLGACCCINSIFACYPYPDLFTFAACSQNLHMKHFQPSYFRIIGPIQGWKRQNFLKQILPFHIMLERHVICHGTLYIILLYTQLNRNSLTQLFFCRSLITQIAL